eukprot:scaffold7402_cov78-Cylindrotheca_fusiformis.AAC.3
MISIPQSPAMPIVSEFGADEMQILGHGDYDVKLPHKSSSSGSNHHQRAVTVTPVEGMSPKWNDLFRYLRSANLADLGAGEIHEATRGSETTMTMYDGHVDKRVFPEACFLPLTGCFWTLVAIPITMAGLENMDDSSYGFYTWARETLKEEIHECIIFCEPGTLLLFSASQFFHATIIPANQDGTRRRLAILHKDFGGYDV